MTFQEFETFIREQDALLVRNKPEYGERERIFAYLVKLGEEYGELCDAVLASVGDQRTGKRDEQSELPAELADVVIVSYLLAERLGIDMNATLARKIKMIQTKHNKELKN